MRRISISCILGLAIYYPTLVGATPYQSPDTIDILRYGTDFSAISASWYQIKYKADGALDPQVIPAQATHPLDPAGPDLPVGTFWDSFTKSNWIKYSADLTPGVWRIGLNAKNFEWDPKKVAPLNYSFHISYITADGAQTTANGNLTIRGSDDEIFADFFTLSIAQAYTVTVHYFWTNDIESKKPGSTITYDANLQISSAFFDRIEPINTPTPEPATWLYLGSGLIIPSLLRKKKPSPQPDRREADTPPT